MNTIQLHDTFLTNAHQSLISSRFLRAHHVVLHLSNGIGEQSVKSSSVCVCVCVSQ